MVFILIKRAVGASTVSQSYVASYEIYVIDPFIIFQRYENHYHSPFHGSDISSINLTNLNKPSFYASLLENNYNYALTLHYTVLYYLLNILSIHSLLVRR